MDIRGSTVPDVPFGFEVVPRGGRANEVWNSVDEWRNRKDKKRENARLTSVFGYVGNRPIEEFAARLTDGPPWCGGITNSY